MDEIQYRDTYHSINERRCYFEKAVNAHACACSRMRRFNLADREGVGCTDPKAHQDCSEWLQIVRPACSFALKQPSSQGVLPHRLEAKVQAGGLLGLAKLLGGDASPLDIADLLVRAKKLYGDLPEVPLPEIITAVVQYEPRRRKNSPHMKTG